ncbi:MAG TPA: ECF-type sigma factor [Nevskiaceae bacterium]|nr:ECF-type sigma factor [Nevskiaceae bacterium]
MNAPDDVTPDSPVIRELSAAFYGDLRRVARSVRGKVGGGQTLQTTALINEAYLKLHRTHAFETREHFLNAAAVAMRHALVDYARARLANKRGGEVDIVPLEEGDDVLAVPEESLVEVDEALKRLAELDPRQARVVECRYFAGYSAQETAQALGITERTVHRDWARAKTWLFRELGPGKL